MSSLAACPGASPGPSIARAAADHCLRRSAWLTDRELQERRRRAVRTVDALLETVEEINLAGRGRQHDPLIPHRLRRLEAAIARPAPPAVHRARNNHELHAALVDWQEVLPDEICPARELHRAVDGEQLVEWARGDEPA